jgi:phage protein D
VLLDGGELWVDGDTLSAHPRGSRARTATLSRGESLREVRITADLAGQATSLVVGGWDRARKSRVTEEATESVVQGELGGDDAGPALLRSAFGERRQTVAHTLAETSEVARAEAEALFAAMCRSFVTARGVAETTADLRVGADVELTGVGPRFDGHYRLVEVRHRFDAEAGLRTEITAERPGLGSPA